MCWCVCHDYLCTKALCASTCMCLHALGGAAQRLKWIPVDSHFQDQVPVESARGGEEDDDEEGRWLSAD